MRPILSLGINQDAYPARLRALKDPPERVHVVGQWPADVPAVAVVGARRASEAGLQAAERLGRSAAEAGVWLVSGGAIGIDGAAHRGALDGGGATLAVLGTPVDDPGPRIHRPLFQAMLQHHGGLMSEIDRSPVRSDFRRRNRLIAALADWVIVVEGQERSGTRSTLEAAHALGRRLGAVTWAMDDARGVQATWVFERGGTPIDGPDALLRWLGCPRTAGAKPTAPASTRTLDDWMQASGSASSALARLTELELEGRGERTGGGRFRSSE